MMERIGMDREIAETEMFVMQNMGKIWKESWFEALRHGRSKELGMCGDFLKLESSSTVLRCWINMDKHGQCISLLSVTSV